MGGAVDLRHGEAAARRQLGRVQFHDRLIGMKLIAFLRENFLHTPAHARTDMHFIHLDCPGNGVPPIAAARAQDRQCD